jgi:EpsD family peptidyl-prolyl cis-trans isomerase
MKFVHGMRIPVLALTIAATLSACGNKPGEEATQVAAKVNKDEITVHQINYELAKIGNISPEQAKQASNRILQGLIEQDLFIQKAIEAKLDRDPQVVQRLDADRRQILAQAYVERVTSPVAQPTDAEISDYYAKNPLLFSDRRIYRLQELNIPVTQQNVESVQAKLAASHSLDEFVAWLKSVNIQANAVQSVKPAEQLPFEILPRIHDLKDGQTIVIKSPTSLNIIVVTGSQNQAVSAEQAKPAISRYLLTARKRDLAEAEIKKLRDAARIEYLGDYAGMDKKESKPAAN